MERREVGVVRREILFICPALRYIVSACFSIIHRVGVGRVSRRDVRLILSEH